MAFLAARYPRNEGASDAEVWFLKGRREIVDLLTRKRAKELV
jgi:hypothetical protein